ncbi:unnamed protein product [Cylindrotheca closterium]|uniref:Uncharacterized protein n=1 Tax=Cylindrotheca closterium TaxID=2856 RepID=A0AAD2CGH5_9STRA|nr:unnamed protein product [Cylindrotheca closterium]
MRLELIEQAKSGRDIWEVDRNTEITMLLTKTKLEKLMLWKGVERKDQPKLIGGKRKKWLEVRDKDPPLVGEWTDEDEAGLTKLRSKDVDIEDTAIGRAKITVQREMKSFFDNLSQEKQQEYLDQLERSKKCSDN